MKFDYITDEKYQMEIADQTNPDGIFIATKETAKSSGKAQFFIHYIGRTADDNKDLAHIEPSSWESTDDCWARVVVRLHELVIKAMVAHQEKISRFAEAEAIIRNIREKADKLDRVFIDFPSEPNAKDINLLNEAYGLFSLFYDKLHDITEREDD